MILGPAARCASATPGRCGRLDTLPGPVDNSAVSGKKESFYLSKLEWLGPILLRGLRVLTSVEALGQEYSFSQVMILQALLMQKETRMNDLARFLGLSKANASGLVDRLVRRGLIERSHGVEDRRVVFVRLTPAGTRIARRLAGTQRKGLALMMRRIPERNLAVFIETLEQVAGAMAESQPRLLPPVRP